MDKDRPPNGPVKRSWLTRMKQAYLREPANNEQLVELLRGAHRKNLFDADLLAMLEGVLHLLGYDHSRNSEAREMEQLETEQLASLGYTNPY